MIEIKIPGLTDYFIQNLVLDYNGTLAVDGIILNGVAERLKKISQKKVKIHVLTADTFGRASEFLTGLPVNLIILDSGNQELQKLEYVKKLGANSVIAIGNGYNDSLMLKEAALGIVVVQGEGASVKAILNSDIVTNNISDALELLLNPLRISASLRK
ncbi:MAG TPA: HAD hydrolase family protein [Bacteroidales bacterium]|jgi:P-type E1-E2 ATPase|nr:HAD hydrolase family protein [Bacteroidales bacterium]HOL98043.1 HAD hydrolase family protein [Bacteroidales bacterium]HPD23629.1 HAD hydrolase family protein [Bacteroidales bacterium]HRS99649.1 HAD hydrolase family protein [Bacteroidales bacterium]HRT80156.1 HAD hydrolase family protein [Bacteroidales bacterium]